MDAQDEQDQSESVHLYPVAMMITGGVIGATLCWMIRGTASGFSAGFWIGAIIVPVILMRGGH